MLVHNKIEIDVDLWLYGATSEAKIFCNNEVYKFQFELIENDLQNVFIRYVSDTSSAKSVDNLDVLIIEFLSGIKKLLSYGGYTKGELRLGIYYDLESIGSLSVHLNNETVKILAQYNLSIESILYPCN